MVSARLSLGASLCPGEGLAVTPEEESSCFLMITRMGATLESDYLGWPVTQSGFKKKELRKVPSAGVGKTQALPLSPLLSLNAPCCWLDSPVHIILIHGPTQK